jgi:hypothetical protein
MTRPSSLHKQSKGAYIKPSWYNILISVIIRIAVSLVAIIAVIERSIYVYNAPTVNANHLFLLGCAWVVALLTLIAHIFTLIGVLQDRNL